MAFRTFVDSAGNEWQVYDVIPRPYERRRYDRRASRDAADGSVSQAEEERREEEDRRLSVGRQSALTVVREGWLTFEHGDERRRLSPIPGAWETSTDAELQEMRDAARVVRRRRAPTPPTAAEPPVTPEPKP